MHVITILAFAFLFWHAEDPHPQRWRLVAENDVIWTALVVVGQLLLVTAAAVASSRRARRLCATPTGTHEAGARFHHRATIVLRGAVLAGFATTVFLTRWPDWFAFARFAPTLQILGDLCVLSPFLAEVLILWLVAYPVECSLRTNALGGQADDPKGEAGEWRRRSYLDFHVRHHVLIVAVPMTLILACANIIRGHEESLRTQLHLAWAPDMLLGAVAVLVFLAAPLMLRRIWRTMPLASGPVRDRLEATCRRIGLRVREILVWHSDGVMINAAVMGIFARVRFVLLSDALLAGMNTRQIEAIFGHEAGHVRHRHIQYLLLFAFVGWLVVAGVMELFVRLFMIGAESTGASVLIVQGSGLLATAAFWGLCFGWLSRRFERQADLFGARCVTPPSDQCLMPCGLHPDPDSTITDETRVCATGVAVFVSALDRVAELSGIPQEERSWRHSSIASRIRFLTSLAADHARAVRFERVIRRAKAVILVAAIAGSAAAAYYWKTGGQPAILGG